jgi:branched-chain amino acid transport system substrate-binding protein
VESTFEQPSTSNNKIIGRNSMITRRVLLLSAAAAAAYAARGSQAARAENAPGVTDTEIKIGQTIPYSGPASAFGVIGRAEAAYFKMINDQGGINGRKINFISLDDGYSPPKTVEQVRRLVEQEHVAFLANTLGTPQNAAIRQYLNDNKVPQLFVLSGAPMFADPQHYPWTIAFVASYVTEAHIYAKHILSTKPDAKIAVLYQNDDFGKSYLNGLGDVLGPDRAAMIVKEASYETSEPTVDSQVVTLQGSGADVLLIAATPKFAAQAIRKSSDLGWAATRYLSYVSTSVAAVLKPAGLEKSKGLISAGPSIDVTDPRWKDTPDMLAWKAFTDKYMSATDFADGGAATGFGDAATVVQVLKQCGNDLSRENIMRQAANLKNFRAPLLWPGITVNTSPTNFSPIRDLQPAIFDGANWEPVGELMSD